MSFQTIKGTFDILPDGVADGRSSGGGLHDFGTAAWRHIEAVVHDVMARFHVQEIRTPVFEPTALIARGIGGSTDIVQKEMFAFERGDTDYVLRPEVTAPVMRSYLQHHLSQRGGTQRLYYIGPCFRAEEPQKGRYRQFHQFGVEFIGTPSPLADAECIVLMLAVYDALGIAGHTLRINTLGDPASRRAYVDALRQYLEPHAASLTETSRQRLQTNPLRILDTKDEGERALLADAPRLPEVVSEASQAHYAAVKARLDSLGVAYVEDPALVRGLDYYTETAFELVSDDLGAQSALGGGGRYDGLAEAVGSSQPVPAVGFAAGFERLFLALQAQQIAMPGPEPLTAFLVALGDEAQAWAFTTAQALRGRGIRTALDLKGRSMKAQMKEANRQGARYAVIVGQDELAQSVAQLRNLDASEQREVAVADLADVLANAQIDSAGKD
ncbi:MAG: histidine--tRNA ligase [Bacteroidota bacterium]